MILHKQTINNICNFKTQEAATHGAPKIFYIFREIPRIKSVSSVNIDSTLRRLYPVTDFSSVSLENT